MPPIGVKAPGMIAVMAPVGSGVKRGFERPQECGFSLNFCNGDFAGLCQLVATEAEGRRDGHPSESAGRISGDFGELAPGDESCRELFAVERGAQQMPLEREVLPNRPEA